MSAIETQDQNPPIPATPLAEAASVKGGASERRSVPKAKGQTAVRKPAPFYRQFGHGPKY